MIAPARERVAARRLLRQLQTEARRQELVSNDVRTVWRGWGQGPVLVLLHGGHGAWSHWVHNIQTLALNHTVWVPDMPGFGDSEDLLGNPHNPDRLQSLVTALLGSLQQLPGLAQGFDLVGFSFGGLVAASLAAESASLGSDIPRVRRLILIGSAGHGGARRQASDLLNWRALYAQARWEAHARNLHSFMLHSLHSVDALAQVVHADACAATRFRSKAISRGAQLPAFLKRFSGPTLLIWGEHDATAIPADIGPKLVQSDPLRQLVLLPNVGHWAQYEQSETVNRLLIDWLATSAGPCNH